MKFPVLRFYFFLSTISCNPHQAVPRHNRRIVWHSSHQTATGKDFSEATVSNSPAVSALATTPLFQEYNVRSLGKKEYHHDNSGSNTKIEHTSAVMDGKLYGYAYELKESDKYKPQLFIALHNNGGTKRHAVWGYIHYGDKYEQKTG